MYVSDDGAVPTRFITLSERRIVSVSTYTVPGAPTSVAPLLACSLERKSPARFVVAYTATRPPPPAPPLYLLAAEAVSPPLARTIPLSNKSVPTLIYTDPPAPEPAFV